MIKGFSQGIVEMSTLEALIRVADDQTLGMVLTTIGRDTIAALIVSELRAATTIGQLHIQEAAEAFGMSRQSVSKKIDNLRIKKATS